VPSGVAVVAGVGEERRWRSWFMWRGGKEKKHIGEAHKVMTWERESVTGGMRNLKGKV
jgi:hypothetical protein